MASASEAECSAVFINTKEAIFLQTTLEEIGNLQTTTLMQVENSTCDVIMIMKVQQKISKSMGIRFYWVRDRVK